MVRKLPTCRVSGSVTTAVQPWHSQRITEPIGCPPLDIVQWSILPSSSVVGTATTFARSFALILTPLPIVLLELLDGAAGDAPSATQFPGPKVPPRQSPPVGHVADGPGAHPQDHGDLLVGQPFLA